jgi:protein-L-isoaspartate O-methyltransferase
MHEDSYRGTELELFSHAVHWKRYVAKCIKKYLRGSVLEVGAGIGSNTELLLSKEICSWLCIEPDAALHRSLVTKVANLKSRTPVQTLHGTIGSLTQSESFDVIFYWDVLEHIEDDLAEITKAVCYLRTGGKLVVVAPAYQWLYSAFDSHIGHFRRYSKTHIIRLVADVPSLEIVQLKYLDSLGIMLNGINRLFTKQHSPTRNQIRFWDHVIVPLSKTLDLLVGYRFGKSLLLIANKK